MCEVYRRSRKKEGRSGMSEKSDRVRLVYGTQGLVKRLHASRYDIRQVLTGAMLEREKVQVGDYEYPGVGCGVYGGGQLIIGERGTIFGGYRKESRVRKSDEDCTQLGR
jgi:hypothetical protein